MYLLFCEIVIDFIKRKKYFELFVEDNGFIVFFLCKIGGKN